MTPEKDYIKILRYIRHNYERDAHLAWDDMRGEYKNAIEAIDKAIEALQDKDYRTSNHKGMNLDKLYKKACSYIKNLTAEELAISLQRAEKDTKDCYDD